MHVEVAGCCWYDCPLIQGLQLRGLDLAKARLLHVDHVKKLGIDIACACLQTLVWA